MTQISRRELLKLLGAASIMGGAALRPVYGKAAAKVVIVGGGIGGMITAKYLRLINQDVHITVIEPDSIYTFCPGSNDVLVGEPISDFQRTYQHSKDRYQLQMIADRVKDIDFNRKQLKTGSGKKIAYDYLVLSPGPGFVFDNIAGWSKELADSKILHAWKAGKQTLMLRDQIRAMPQGGVMVIAPPPMPFRCPPAPYERASFVAEWMAQHNPRGKIIILDNNPGFVFQKQYIKYWKQRRAYGTDKASIEWISSTQGGAVTQVDAHNMTVRIQNGETIRADVINLIPTNTANRLLIRTGLTQGKDWAAVNHHDMSSLVQKDVYVIGDSADFNIKTGYLAADQGKVVAQAIHARLHNQAPGQPLYVNDCLAKAGKDFGMTLTETYREREGKLQLAQSIQRPLSSESENTFMRHFLVAAADNWQRSFRRDVFD